MKKILLILLGLFFNYFVSQNLTDTENYVYKKTHLTDPSDPVQKQLESVQYLDGLGRPKQVISIKSTPLGQDIVVPIIYDQFGRKTKDYLPVPVQTTNAGIQTAVTENTVNSYYGVTNAFSENELESSPLSRIFQSAHQGEEWKMSSGHTIKYAYDANSTDDQVKKYQVTTTWDNTNQIYQTVLSSIALFDENRLYKFSVKDEDNNEKIVFKDLYGHVLLIRKNDGTQNLDTYYVYDSNDHIAYVIPPLASILSALTPTILNNLCYQYLYDNKNRLVEKKVPGKGWEFMVYDNQERLVATRDSNLEANGQWLYTKYDQFGRVAITGVGTGGSRNAEQIIVNGLGSNNVNRVSTPFFNRQGMDVCYGNPDNTYPNSTKWVALLSLNYYDTYPPESPAIPTQILGQNILSQDAQNSNSSTKSFPTASYVKNIEDDNWTKNFIWYDKKGRAIGSHSINHLGGYTKTESELDFSGTQKQAVTRHKRLDTDTERVITETFTYDHQNRLLIHKHKVDNDIEEILSQNDYNEISQLRSKKVGGTNIITPLQKVDYAYNIRGWMTMINNPANLGTDLFGYKINYNVVEGLEVPNSDYSNLLVKPKYNGNIAEVSWKTLTTENEPLKRYGYSYDSINRLNAGFYQKEGSENAQEYFEKMDYDLNGNISRLQRSAETFTGTTTALKIDNLKYDYDGNRLTKVTETQIGNSNGYPYLASHNFITYDDNGNMKSHLDKKIASINYNFLDLPSEIIGAPGKTKNIVSNIYRADGIKVSKIISTTQDTMATEYIDGFQYKFYNGLLTPINPNGLQFIPTSEGYYDFITNSYVYNYTDQIGNVRLSYSDTNEDGVMQPRDMNVQYCQDMGGGNMACYDIWTPGEIAAVNNYYPFGLLHNYTYTTGNAYQHKYQGQELQENGWYSFKWRNYMPDVGRFFNVDPLSEVYAYQSHYNFSENRVVDAREIEGLEAKLLNTGASFDGKSYDGGVESNITWSDGLTGAGIQEVTLQGQSTNQNNSSSFTLGDAGRMGANFIPIVGSGLDIYEGARDGNWVQFGFGVGGMVLDVATLGTGSIIKGGVKTIGTELVENSLKIATKEVAEAEAKQGLKALSKGQMSNIIGAGSDAKVVRGGTCLACQFENGSGVVVDANGLLNGVSVNSVPGLSISELSVGIPNGKIGTTTVKAIEKIGGKVVASPTKNNPFHSTLSGITAQQAEGLFSPVIKNPLK